jgi:hypothetical protein
MLVDDPWTVSPLRPVLAEGTSSSVRDEEPGSCRLERFLRGGRPSEPRLLEEAELECRSALRFSLDSLLREDLRLGERCEEAFEDVRASVPSVVGKDHVVSEMNLWVRREGKRSWHVSTHADGAEIVSTRDRHDSTVALSI